MVDYVYKPYNEKFPILFEQEKDRLKQYLTKVSRIEHFGSTAVSGLGGKGIIDIYVIVPEQLLNTTFEDLEKAGYEARPNSGTATRFIFVKELNKNDEKERYHVHVTADKNEYERDLIFRDWLRTHPDDIQKYADIKQKAAQEANQSKDEYMRIKKPVIQEILAKALNESL